MWRIAKENEEEENLLLLSATCVLLSKKKHRQRRFWIRPTFRSRENNCNEVLLENLRKDDIGLNGELRSSFKIFLRLSNIDFEKLLCLIGPVISKKNTNYRAAISTQDRLAITLRFLATGDSYHSLMYLFKVSAQSISQIIPKVCDALIHSLQDYIKRPNTAEEWRFIANDFKLTWNFPLCLGAMDGKHIVIEAPNFSGSEFFNYKGTFSIVLFAIVDANYKFIYANIGCQGRISDGGVFRSTLFRKLLDKSLLNLPKKEVLPARQEGVPYVLVADDAFPLSPNIMKPYAGHQEKGSNQRIFNYRLSRARRIVENVFGILASVFRVLRKPLLLQPEKAEKVVFACVYFHNYLRANNKTTYNPSGTFDVEDLDSGTITEGSWRSNSQPLQSLLPLQRTARKSSVEAANIRNEFSEYFVSDMGQVPWQAHYS